MAKKTQEKNKIQELTVDLPTLVEHLDILKLENLSLKKELAEKQVGDVAREIEQHVNSMRSKYQLGPQDAINPQTLEISRK